MLTVDKVKGYLCIPVDVTEDDELIQDFIQAAYIYLKNACKRYEELYSKDRDFTAQADLFAKLYACELYQNRDQFSGDKNEPSFNTRALMLQLQTY